MVTRVYITKFLIKKKQKKLFRGSIANVTGIYRRSSVEKYNIRYNETPGASYQDVGFKVQILLNMERGFVINKAFYRYRQDNPNSSIANREKVFCVCDEQRFIYNKIKEKKALFDEYKPYYNYILYTTNMFTFNRIADEFKHEFMQRIKSEYKALADEKEIDFSIMTDNERSDVEKIMDNSDDFVDRYMEKANKLYEAIKGYKYVIIYGAGAKAGETLELLRGRLHMLGQLFFATTERPDAGDIKGGYPIKCIYDLKDKSDEAVVVLGVSELYVKEMMLKLDEIGFTNRVKIF